MKKTAYKMNINQFISLCVFHNSAIQLWTPKEIGKACAVISISWNIPHHNGTQEIDTGGNEQLEGGQIIIITDL